MYTHTAEPRSESPHISFCYSIFVVAVNLVFFFLSPHSLLLISVNARRTAHVGPTKTDYNNYL